MAAQDIITAAEFKSYFGVSGSDKDTIIGTFITDCSSWIESYLGSKVVSQTVTNEIGNGNGTEKHYTNFGPIVSVTTLEKRGSPDDSWAAFPSDTDHILVDPVNKAYIELYNTYFPYGRSNIRVTYAAGYSTVPNPIKQVAYEMVTMRFRDSNDAAFGGNRLGLDSMTQTNAGGGSSSKSFIDMMPRWERVLNRYKRRRPQANLVR